MDGPRRSISADDVLLAVETTWRTRGGPSGKKGRFEGVLEAEPATGNLGCHGSEEIV